MFYQASCYEWSLLVALVLRDAETIQRLITRSHDHALETMAAVLKAIGKRNTITMIQNTIIVQRNGQHWNHLDIECSYYVFGSKIKIFYRGLCSWIHCQIYINLRHMMLGKPIVVTYQKVF